MIIAKRKYPLFKSTSLFRHIMSAQAETSRSVVQSVYAQETPEGAGAIVRRAIGGHALRNLSPFLMLDYAKISKGAGFPDHPHRGQSTISYILNGKSQHEDFLGNSGILEKGDVQWMTAGRGIMHSEIPYFDPDPEKEEEAEALQLWVDLPADKKNIEPSYQERKAKFIDKVRPSEGVEITVISGESHGVTGFVRPVGGCWYLDVKLEKPGAQVFQPIPAGWTAFAFVITGQVQVESKPEIYSKYHTLVLSAQPLENGVKLRRPESSTEEPTRLILLAGEPLDQPVVQYGPFVVTSESEARKAIMDFRTGRNGFEKAVGWESKIGREFRAAN